MQRILILRSKKHAIFLALLALTLAMSTSLLIHPTSASAGLAILNEPARRSLDCGSDGCIYIPAVVSAEDSGAVRRISGRSEALTLYQTMYLASNVTAAQWTGDHDPCVPGATASAFRDAVLLRVNYFRRMAGVPDLQGLRAEINTAEQEAALMMSRNQTLSHTPGTNWACYTEPGREAAGKSNLALGANGPQAIDLYMNDYGLASMGHRRWLLYPQTQWAATGDIPGGDGYPATNAFRIYDENLWGERPATRDPFVAWPPATYVPYTVVYPYWSFSLPDADFSQATVSVTQGGRAVAIKQYAPQAGFGEPALVWSIEGIGAAWLRPAADTVYQVSVRGVRVGGQARDYSYTMTVIDPKQ